MTLEQEERMVKAFEGMSTWLKYLGAGDNGDQRGAIEFLASSITESNEAIARGLERVAEAIDRIDIGYTGDIEGAITKIAYAPLMQAELQGSWFDNEAVSLGLEKIAEALNNKKKGR